MALITDITDINYTAPPTCAAFHKSEAFGRLLAGPVGSGKTTSCIIEQLRRATQQTPARDGMRYTRFAVVRQTLKQLKDTVMKDCKDWLGRLGHFKVADNQFILDFDDVRSEWMFLPLEDATDQGRLLSMQLTGAWLSECIEMNIDILAPLSGRIGRYPRGGQGAPKWKGIIADTNFPALMTPWNLFMDDPPMDWQVFKQPSGLAPTAENLNWLVQTEETIKLPIDHPARLAMGRKYYDRLVEMYGIESNWVKRYVKAEYGDDPSGQAVFVETWRTNFHTVETTNVIPGYPLIVGQDFGRNPWSLICQIDHMGRLIVHEEIAATNIGLEKHIQERLKPRLLSEKYIGHKVALVGDPAGTALDSIGEENSFMVLKRLGLPAFPAPTNDIDPRLRAVEAYLGRQVNGGPALAVNKNGCPFLIRAMSGGYRFKKRKGGSYAAVPDKDDAEGYSHVADTLQYVCLVAHGGLASEIARRLQPRTTSQRPRISPLAWT